MIPLRDDNPTRSFPILTLALIAVNVATFAYEASLPPHMVQDLVGRLGVVPALVTAVPSEGAPPLSAGLVSFLTSMFLHGDLMHLAGNMLFLWIFGNNVEDRLGRVRFLIFYLACGFLAALSQVAIRPDSTVPMIGASGAIAGVLGAYLLLFPHARVLTLVPFVFVYLVRLPAFVVLGLWFVFQITSSLVADPSRGGVAWFAHVGGFVAGMLLLLVLVPRGAGAPPRPAIGGLRG